MGIFDPTSSHWSEQLEGGAWYIITMAISALISGGNTAPQQPLVYAWWLPIQAHPASNLLSFSDQTKSGATWVIW